jgi:hypothetical protein
VDPNDLERGGRESICRCVPEVLTVVSCHGRVWLSVTGVQVQYLVQVCCSSALKQMKSDVHYCRTVNVCPVVRGVLTKTFFPNFGIISGFIAVGITCRLRISGLGPVSYWYHDTNL